MIAFTLSPVVFRGNRTSSISMLTSVSKLKNKFQNEFTSKISSSFSCNTYKPTTLLPISTSFQVCLMSINEGWESTRLKLSELTIDPAFESNEISKIPGVHFITPPHITISDLLRLVRQETPDEWVNEMARTLLGWFRRTTDLDDNSWDNSHVSEEWISDYVNEPPDFIGDRENFTPERDKPVKKAVQKLTRSIQPPYKQILTEVLGPKGFKGWTIRELTPNRTRRATVANFIIYWYRIHYPNYEWS